MIVLARADEVIVCLDLAHRVICCACNIVIAIGAKRT
jgi:hypothetical protein